MRFARGLLGQASLAVFVSALTACGFGSASISAALHRNGGRSGAGGNAPTVLGEVLVDPATLATSPLRFSFRVTDAEADPANLVIRYAIGDNPPVAAETEGGSLVGVASSGSGVVHERGWDFASQLATGGSRVDGVTLIVELEDGRARAVSPPFHVGNDAPIVEIQGQPQGEVSGAAAFRLVLSDSGSDPIAVIVEYESPLGSDRWLPATPLGSSLTEVSTSATGRTVDFVWDSSRDAAGAEFDTRFRFVPTDGVAIGDEAMSAAFAIDNNAAPVAIVDGSAFFATPDTRRGIPIPFVVQDAEGDPVRVVFQWRTANGGFPALPFDRQQLEQALTDPAQRIALQIATAFPTEETGWLAPAGSAAVRMPDLAVGPTVLGSAQLAQSRLDVLRGSAIPTAAAGRWTVRPLVHPIAGIPLGDGETAVVLDRPAAGQWRLREIALADGMIERVLAAGSDGEPDALALWPGGTSLLLATDSAGEWRLRHVDLTTGAVSPWYASNGAIAVGTVRGLATVGAARAALTVGGALIVVDGRDSGGPVERLVLGNLDSPIGLCSSPKNPTRLFVAERDWVRQGAAAPEGRVLVADLDAASVVPLQVTGGALLRPTSVALDPNGTTLWVLTDADDTDGATELSGVQLMAGVGGASFQLTDRLPATILGLVRGPRMLSVLCDPASDALWIGGGVEQSRDVVAWDAGTTRATTSVEFTPVATPGSRWCITDSAELVPAGSPTRRDVFVWDSSDVPVGGQVILRATPYDQDFGLATDTGVPRVVHSGIRVSHSSFGGPATNAGIRSLATLDVDGDGLLDVVTANRGLDSLSVFLQVRPGVFSSVPSSRIQGTILNPLDDPIDLAVLDADGLGFLDLVCANASGDNLRVIQQFGRGSFSVSLLALGSGGGVSAVATGRLNGDGRDDIVAAMANTDTLQLFFQLPTGMFQPSASVTLGDARIRMPVDVAIADLDGDGDADLVAANSGSNNLAVFRQSAPGIYSQPASLVLGGLGTTDGPISVAVADFDGDGRADIASANVTGNDLTVFLQRSDGSFPTTPDQRLFTTGGPLQPQCLAAADVDGDGAIDLLVSDRGDHVLVFQCDPVTHAFSTAPSVLGGPGQMDEPTALIVSDVSGDGRPDILFANEGAGTVGLLRQAGPGDFAAVVPLLLGDADHTAGVRAVAFADLDNDGDLDMATANHGSDTISIYPQLGPAVFATTPMRVLGGSAATAGPISIVAADLDADGRADLATSNLAAATVTVFVRDASGAFPTEPSATLGQGLFVEPGRLCAADLDNDGDVDLICCDPRADRLLGFAQVSPGAFANTPTWLLGGTASTRGPDTVICVDIDQDGDLDVICSAPGSNAIAVFRQTGPGVFATTPTAVLGSAASTPSAACVLAVRIDADAVPDLVCLTANHKLAVFLATGPGVFPSAPTLSLTDTSVQTPRALAAADLNGSGWSDLLVASDGTDRITTFMQLGQATFPFAGAVLGGAGQTDDASQILALDVDRDGDIDVVTVQPSLNDIAIFFNAH